jgi:esterase/lipase
MASTNTSDTALLNNQMDISTIDKTLVSLEAAYDDIVAETEKSVRWFDGKTQTEFSLVYLHGYSASRKELSPVTENLADLLGANVFYTRLRGHGRSDDAMAEARLEDWLRDAEVAYKIGALIGKKVIVISTSTGGTLATWLSAQDFADRLVANLMVSPNFGIKSWSGEILRWDWGLKLAKLVSGPYRSFEPSNEIHDSYWTQRYPMEALVPMINLVDQIREMDKSSITAPQLFVYSPDDQVISVRRILETSQEFTNADVSLHPFSESEDTSQHVLAGDACSPSSTDHMVKVLHQFIQSSLIKER